jgi:hypothetical protein
VLPFTVACLALLYAARRWPSQAPYVDQDFLRTVIRLQWVVFVGGWAAYIGIGLWLRRRAPDNRTYVLAGCHYYAIVFAIASYYPATSRAPSAGWWGSPACS